MQDLVTNTIIERQLLEPGDHVLIAVSGGPDSVALLHWLYQNQKGLQLKLACAHVNHGFRGQESDEDEAFVAELCRNWNIPYYPRKANLNDVVAAGGVNLQAIARDYRYQFLIETADHIGANRIALAHHRDDQVETILMRLLRGTGTTGLIGMPYQRQLSDQVIAIRPFLDVSKEEILNYLKLRDLSSRIDSSNLKTDYMRNRVRLQLLPELLHYNPNLSSSILSLARMIEEDEDELLTQAKTQFLQITEFQSKDEIRLSLSAFHAIPLSLQRRVIKLICNYLIQNEEEVPFLHIEALRSLFIQDEPHQWDLPWDIRVYIRYGEAVFKRGNSDTSREPFHCTFTAPATIWIPQANGRLSCSITTQIEESESAMTVYFDYDRIERDLVLRTRSKGDRMWIKGLGGHKKVKDIFIDNKIPKEDRDSIPLLFAGEELLWIIGVRKSSFGCIDQGTKRYLCCRFERLG